MKMQLIKILDLRNFRFVEFKLSQYYEDTSDKKHGFTWVHIFPLKLTFPPKTTFLNISDRGKVQRKSLVVIMYVAAANSF